MIVTDVLVARQKALDAGGSSNLAFQDVERDFAADTEEAFEGDISDIQSKREEYKNRYVNVEGDIIVEKTIGGAQKSLLQMKSSNA